MLDNYSWANGIVLSGRKSSTAARLSARRHTTSLRVYGKNPSNEVSPSGKTVDAGGNRYCLSVSSCCVSCSTSTCSAKITTSARQPLPALRPHHVLLRGDGHHGCQQHIQCLYHPVCHAAGHHPGVPRLTHGLHRTSHHHTDMLHLPALSA